MDYVLPDDCCRCFNDECKQKKTCVRWLCRQKGGEWVVCNDNLNPENLEECEYYWSNDD